MFGVRKDSGPESTADKHISYRFGEFTGELNGTLKTGSFNASQSQEKSGFGFGAGKRDGRPLSRDDKEQLAEERRLFGDYSYVVQRAVEVVFWRRSGLTNFASNDPADVRIGIPGTSSRGWPKSTSTAKVRCSFVAIPSPNVTDEYRLLQSFSTFKPTNTLGPRQNKRNFRTRDNDTRSPYFPSRPNEDVSNNENGDHSRKKQKTEMPKNLIEIEDGESSSPASLSKSTSPIRSLNHHSAFGSQFRPRQRAVPATPEYWETEEAVQPPTVSAGIEKRWAVQLGDQCGSFDAEAFTKGAKKERINRLTRTSNRAPHPGAKTGRSVISAVEIPKPSGGSQNRTDDVDSQTYNGCRKPESRESPDEIQGGPTVGEFWRANNPAERALPPSNIRPTFFPTVSRNRKRREGRRRKDTAEITFSLKMFRCGPTVIDGPLQLVVDSNKSQLVLKPAAGWEVQKSYELKKVTSIFHDNQDDLTRVRLKFSKSADLSSDADMIFLNNRDRCCFRDLVQELVPGVKEHSKGRSWMDRAFNNATHAGIPDQPVSDFKRQSLKETPDHKNTKVQPPSQKRLKLSDTLLNGTSDVSRDSPTSSKQMKMEATLSPKLWTSRQGSLDPLSHSHPHPHPQVGSMDEGVPIPVKTYGKPVFALRATRSSTRQQHLDIDSDNDLPSEASLGSGKLKKWSNPLVYPKTGKKRAEVEAHDLARLRNGEFLNDNLIGLYVRFLEHHLERQHPEILNRIYFFNSFFFASLTNTPRGKRGINYQGVEKWTRSVDIFSYDYVVVPINESAHWYMAVICNLPTLFESRSDDDNSDKETVSPKAANAKIEEPTSNLQVANDSHEAANDMSGDNQIGNGKAGNLTTSFRSMTLLDTLAESSSLASPTEIPNVVESTEKDEWPAEDENQVSAHFFSKQQAALSTPAPPTKNEEHPEGKGSKSNSKKKKRGHKSRPSLPKYEPKQPVIITFDSLGCPRSPTIRILREYLEEEAKSKRSTAIDGKEIKGMTAHQIPLQPNYSDCGLYLLAYLEKFVQDPDIFITKLLQRAMDSKEDWPNLKSGVLRRRLRDFLNQLYDEVESEKQDATFLADSIPLNILLVDADADMQKTPPKLTGPEKPTSHPTSQSIASPSPSYTGTLKSDPTMGGETTVKDKRSATPIPPSVDEKPAKHGPSPCVIEGDKRPETFDSFLDDIEAVVSNPYECKSAQYKDVIQVPRTPSPQIQQTQVGQGEVQYISNSPLMENASKISIEGD
ncbi:Ulp1 protease family protein [Emydomyces testavorans]|uniref:Ulp1 protease family protein n=1 Tax=Emydomyces testavorans TaxID=2070801 RepID=A0AAF0IIT1_9EURO|nr:Ulp1 protease family protein [Emydomyces testavorans]